MRPSLARLAILFLALTKAATAGEIDDFNAAIEQASSHNRVAIGYLRTGNSDLAAREIDRLRDAWNDVSSRFAKPPAAFAGHAQLYANTMLNVKTVLVAASIMINSRHDDVARDALLDIRNELYGLRKAAGIVVLADCVRDVNDAMDALFAYNDVALDWTKPAIGAAITAKANAYGAALAYCDNLAAASVRDAPEFRRLIDGAKASLTFIPKAIESRDAGLLHRVLIELRSFDNLLAFRFG
ncbi:MAG: hypothetical protein ACR2K5_14755 [Pseudolabrys sp.]